MKPAQKCKPSGGARPQYLLTKLRATPNGTRYSESLLYLLFFLSGISGLIYQVVWVRVFGNVFGNTVYSASAVVAVFMLGLGAGSYFAGRWADRRYSTEPSLPLLAYGYFELTIAAMGAAIALVLPHLDRLSVFATSYQVDANGWYVLTPGSYAARVAIGVALLTPITLLMGGTLTLLIRYLVRAEVEVEARRIALLYAVNTAGAAAGCFLTDFTLVPIWGLLKTQLLAVALNAIAGAGAILLSRLKAAPTERTRPDAGRSRGRKSVQTSTRQGAASGVRLQPDLSPIAIALALSGFAGLGMEILWFRHFSIMLGAFRAVFALLLTVILVGIGTGALAAAALQRRWSNPGSLLMAIQSLFILFTLAGMWSADSSAIDRTVSDAIGAFRSAATNDQLSSPSAMSELWFNVRPMLLELAVPALLMGFSFPLGNALIQHAEQSVGGRAGALYLANTAGAVAGSVVTGFVLLPWLGLQASTTVLMLAAAIGLVPIYQVVRLKPDPTGDSRRIPTTTSIRQESSVGSAFRRTLWIPPAIAVASLVGWFLLPSDFIRARALPRPEPNERVLNESEGINEIVSVTETSGKGRRLMTNGHAMSATWPLSQRYMRALAHVPLLMIDNPTRALVIGFGVGNTTHAATLHPSIQRVEVADLSRNVLDHAPWFAATNADVLRDSRVTVYLNDGRHHLLLGTGAGAGVGAGLKTRPYGDAYDLITLEPPPIGYAGVSSLYSEEFYRLARARLKPEGLVSQWLPAYQVSNGTTLSMIKSFVDVFPQSVLLSGAQADLILVGANDRIEVDPNELFTALSQRSAVRADLARLDLGTPREIVGMFVGSSTTLANATRDAIPVTDDRPVQEFGVRSLLNRGESVPGSVVDLSRVAEWCPKCFDNGMPVRVVEGLDLYLALLSRAYSASPEEGARIRAAADNGRRVAGSAYLGAAVPETAEVHNDLGITYASRGLIDQAIAEFRQSLQLDADSAETLWHLGAALASKGDLEEAAELLRRSVQRDPSNKDAQHDLETVMTLQRQHQRIP
jgi:spermidine synthase